MSNERSPRESCWTTTGTRGMACSLGRSYAQPEGCALAAMLAYVQPLGCRSGVAYMSTVRREILLPVERERAWELLTEPTELAGWLADEVEFSPEEGAPLRAAWDDGEERAGVVEEV